MRSCHWPQWVTAISETMTAPSLICPACRGPLQPQPRLWRCAQGHSFDVAREGYVNLLLVQQKRSRDPGDSAEMVLARREFLAAGHYSPLRDAVRSQLSALKPQAVLDVGCGEGYYTQAFKDCTAQVTGLDISKPAIQQAARRFPGITWLVGTGAALPVADASVDVVTSLFTPQQVGEMRRVLKPGGHVLLVTPAADHLWTLREQLFDEVRAHDPEKFRPDFDAGFEPLPRQDVRFALTLDQTRLRQLLHMTPYVWKAKLEKRAALEQRTAFETQAAFSLQWFRRKS